MEDIRTVEPGKKFDNEKLRWHLLPFEQIEQVVKVLTYGAVKYGEDPDRPNWQKLENPEHRYFSALMRHIAAYKKGELVDPESGINHLAHAAVNVLFLMYFQDSQFTENQITNESRINGNDARSL